MTDPRKSFQDNRRLEAALRRAVGVRFARPSLRSMLRACSVYANVFAAVVALGLPTAGAVRRAAGSAMAMFETSVRSANDAAFTGTNLLESPVDLSGVTESAYGAPESAESPRTEAVFGPAVAVAEEPSLEPMADGSRAADSRVLSDTE